MNADISVIGAGIVGLAISQRLAKLGHDVLLLEKESTFGTGVSSRSSEIIHAGLYYAPGSLKAKLCREGRDLLYDYCIQNQINHTRTGKLFVAITVDEISQLSLILSRAKANGISDLIEVDKNQLKQLEPEVSGVAGILSPSSGIVDSHGLMTSLFNTGRSLGVNSMFDSPLEMAEPNSDGWILYIGGKEPRKLRSRVVINAAGLYSTKISQEVFPGRDVPSLYPMKGCYLRYSGHSPIKHIVCPAFLPGEITDRMDAVPDLRGGLRFGPTSEKAKSLDDFTVDPDLGKSFFQLIQRYLPTIDVSRLVPDIAGIRPRIFAVGQSPADYRFEWGSNWLDLWGLESPALTSCLAIAEHVLKILETLRPL